MEKNKYINRDECRRIMLDIMTEIDRVCTENNIPYTIGGGTLIGAVRHKGFIPWDDDIDIFVERNDYDRLIQVLKKSDCEWLSLLDATTDGYYYPFAKATDNRTIAKMEDNVTSHGIWVDIFPMENVPDSALKKKIFLKKCQLKRAVIISIVTDFSSLKMSAKKIFKYILKMYAKIVGYKNVYKKTIKYMCKYNGTPCKCETVTWTPYGKEYMEKELMKNISNYEFEDRLFKGISNNDIWLRRTYGNYMQLPPENKRKTHQIIAYWK